MEFQIRDDVLKIEVSHKETAFVSVTGYSSAVEVNVFRLTCGDLKALYEVVKKKMDELAGG